DGTIEFRDLASGHLRHASKAGAVPVARIRVSDDGTRLATILDPCPGGEFSVWDTTTGQALRGAPEFVGGKANAIEFSHRGDLLAISRHDDDSITLWDLAQNRQRHRTTNHTWVLAP